MINLDQLIVFLTAARYGNYSKAGKELNMSQPAVSQTISHLEQRFHIKLFEKQGRSVRLTEAGQSLRPLALELVGGARRLDETMLSLQGEIVGEMDIACSTASGKYLLPGLIAGFRQVYSNVRINIPVCSRSDVFKRLTAGEIPFGFTSKRLDYSYLQYEEFFNDQVVLIVPASHRWAKYPTIYPDDLLDEPLILREEGSGTREVMLEGLQRSDILPDMLKIVMELGNSEAIAMAVEEGIGVAFISRLAARQGIKYGKLIEVKVEGIQLTRWIYIIRNQRFPLSRAQDAFWNYLLSSRQDLLKKNEIGPPNPVLVG